MSLALAHGAHEIWDMRMNRKRPNEVVFVTLVGPLNEGNFQVRVNGADRIEQMDWRWARDLSVCVVFHDRINPHRVTELTKAIVRQSPNGGYVRPFSTDVGYLWMWDVKKQDGFLLTWWKGLTGIPELEIESIPEQFTFEPMSRFDRKAFEGVTLA